MSAADRVMDDNNGDYDFTLNLVKHVEGYLWYLVAFGPSRHRAWVVGMMPVACWLSASSCTGQVPLEACSLCASSGTSHVPLEAA